MTWEIALGVIALLGFAGTSAAQAWKLSKTIGSLESAVTSLESAVKEFRCNAHATHEKLFSRLDEHGKRLSEHEVRIKNLEKEKNGEKTQ